MKRKRLVIKIERKPNYLYYVDSEGYVCEVYDQANEKWKNVQIAERLLNRYKKDLNASGVII